MNFSLFGQNNFNDLPIETQMEVYKWEKWMQPHPKYVEKQLGFGDIVWVVVVLGFIISFIIGNAKKK